MSYSFVNQISSTSGVAFDSLKQLKKFGTPFGRLRPDHLLSQQGFKLRSRFGSPWLKRLSTVFTREGMGRVRRITRRARSGCHIRPFADLNVHAVQRRIPGRFSIPKACDIPRGDFRPSRAALSVFNQVRRRAFACQPRGVRLAKVRGRNRLCHLSTLTSGLEYVQKGTVGQRIPIRQLTPQRRVRVVLSRMFFESPRFNPGHGRDKRHASLARFAVKGDTQPQLRGCNIADSQGLEFFGARTGIKRQGYQRLITRVMRALNHGDYVTLPAKHISRIRRGIVAFGRAGRDPRNAFRRFIGAGHTRGKDTNRGAIIPVGLLVIIRAIDPRQHAFGRVFVREYLSDWASLFGHADTVPKQFFVSMVRIDGVEQKQLIREFEQYITVGFVPALAGFELGSKGFDESARVNRHTGSLSHGLMNMCPKARGGLSGKFAQAYIKRGELA